jgi:hypothetical protein
MTARATAAEVGACFAALPLEAIAAEPCGRLWPRHLQGRVEAIMETASDLQRSR